MKTINTTSVLAVMNLFNNESYYKYAVEVLWILRSTAMKSAERDGENGVSWDTNHPNFWIAEITNEVIGRALIDGYNYMSADGCWYVSESRNDESGFLTYDEATRLAKITTKETQMNELYRLRDSVRCYANDTGNPAYNIYKVTNNLLEALSGRKSLCA